MPFRPDKTVAGSSGRITLLILLLALLLLHGCAVAPPTAAPDTAALLQQAQKEEAAGHLEIAARQYLRLAALSDPEDNHRYRLHAADLLIRGNYIDQARRIFDTLTGLTTARERAQLQLLKAKVALATQQPSQALRYLDPQLSRDLPPEQQRELHYLRAESLDRLGQFVDAALSRITLGSLIEDEVVRKHNDRLIWRELLQGSSRMLQQASGSATSDTQRSWLSLALIVKLSEEQPAQLQQRLDEWLAQYPEHGVPDTIIASLQALATTPLRQPQHIALLLPLSGSYAKPATALREGLLTAYYQRSDRDYRPRISIYDTDKYSSARKAYAAAIKDGADFVIGPLGKEGVNQLSKMGKLDSPTLTLNYSEASPPYAANLFQFGLSPEDEARQVAERAWLDGHNQAIALIPEGKWAERVLDAFSENWQALGGLLLEVQTYPASNNDFSSQIKKVLNIDESIQRFRAIRLKITEHVHFEPRRRQDADFLFLVAFPRQARLIRPQMKFHYAGNLPIYATSHIYTGQPNRTADRDMDGIIFCDMPWVMNPVQQTRTTKGTLARLWPELSSQYTRFFAMGYDAFGLSSRLGHINLYRHENYDGQTGKLQLDDDNVFFRQLGCGRFKRGLPRPL